MRGSTTLSLPCTGRSRRDTLAKSRLRNPGAEALQVPATLPVSPRPPMQVHRDSDTGGSVGPSRSVGSLRSAARGWRAFRESGRSASTRAGTPGRVAALSSDQGVGPGPIPAGPKILSARRARAAPNGPRRATMPQRPARVTHRDSTPIMMLLLVARAETRGGSEVPG